MIKLIYKVRVLKILTLDIESGARVDFPEAPNRPEKKTFIYFFLSIVAYVKIQNAASYFPQFPFTLQMSL